MHQQAIKCLKVRVKVADIMLEDSQVVTNTVLKKDYKMGRNLLSVEFGRKMILCVFVSRCMCVSVCVLMKLV